MKRTSIAGLFLLAFAVAAFAAGTGEGAAEQEGTVSLSIMQTFPASFTQEDNPVIAHLEETLDLELTYEVPPLQNYGERQRLVLASGDFPDVMMFGGNPYDRILLDAVDNDIVQPLTQEIEQAPNIQKWTNPISWAGVRLKNDDEIYAVPGNTIVRADGLFLRQDWLENLGMSIPASHEVTREEFTEILRRFTTDDPDGNGENDTYGLSFAANDGNLWLPLGWSFGVGRSMGEDWWRPVEGEDFEYMPLKYARNHDNMIRALEYHQMLWNEGYLDQNWPANTGSLRNERVWSGISGGRWAFAGHVYGNWLPQVQKNNPNADATYIVGVKNDEGEVTGPGFGTGMFRINVVLTPGKEAAAVNYFDYLLSDDGYELLKSGIEGVHYNMVDGEKQFTEEYDNYGWRTYLALVRRYNDPSFFIPQTLPQEQIDTMSEWLAQCVENVVMSADFGFRPEMVTEQRYIDARDELAQTISQIVAGQLEVDAWWDALDDWYASGGQEYLTQVNEWIRNNM